MSINWKSILLWGGGIGLVLYIGKEYGFWASEPLATTQPPPPGPDDPPAAVKPPPTIDYVERTDGSSDNTSDQPEETTQT